MTSFYNEIKISFDNFQHLGKELLSHEVGKKPLLLKIVPEFLKEYRTQDVLVQLERVFRELAISPKFPYPCYVVTKDPVISPFIPILKKESDFPQHFKQWPENGEFPTEVKEILQKIKNLDAFISSHHIDEMMDLVKKQEKDHFEFKELIKKNLFFQSIEEALNDPKRV